MATAFQPDAFQQDAFQIDASSGQVQTVGARNVRTFTCTPGFPLVREAMTFTSAIEFDTGLIHLFNRSQRPLYKFEVRLEPLTKVQAESLSAFHSFHQGAASFLWDGGQWGTINNNALVGEGDSSRRDFFLPNRYIGVGSVAIRTANQATGATSNWAASSSNSWPYSLNANPGILVFANSSNTIPASGHDLMAVYACRYRCVFEPGGIKVSNISRGLFVAELKLTEVSQVS